MIKIIYFGMGNYVLGGNFPKLNDIITSLRYRVLEPR